MWWVRVLHDRPRSSASRCKSRKEHFQVSIDGLKTTTLTLAAIHSSVAQKSNALGRGRQVRMLPRTDVLAQIQTGHTADFHAAERCWCKPGRLRGKLSLIHHNVVYCRVLPAGQATISAAHAAVPLCSSPYHPLPLLATPCHSLPLPATP